MLWCIKSPLVCGNQGGERKVADQLILGGDELGNDLGMRRSSTVQDERSQINDSDVTKNQHQVRMRSVPAKHRGHRRSHSKASPPQSPSHLGDDPRDSHCSPRARCAKKIADTAHQGRWQGLSVPPVAGGTPEGEERDLAYSAATL